MAAGRRAGGGLAGAGARPRRRRRAAAVVEVPLLFEAGLEEIYDATIAVVCGRGGARASARRPAGTRRSTSATRASCSQEEKARRATFVVRNDGTVEELEAELSAVLAKLGG